MSLWLLLAVTVSQIPCFWWHSFQEYWSGIYLFRLSLNWYFSYAMIRLRLWTLWGTQQSLSTIFIIYQGSYNQPYITVDVDLEHLDKGTFVRFLHCKLTLLFLFPSNTLWKGVTMCSLHLRTEIYAPLSWGQSIYIDYLEFYCIGYLSILLLCIYLLNHLFISVWTHGY